MFANVKLAVVFTIHPVSLLHYSNDISKGLPSMKTAQAVAQYFHSASKDGRVKLLAFVKADQGVQSGLLFMIISIYLRVT